MRKKKEIPLKQQLCIECRRCCKSIGIYIDPEVYAAPKDDVIGFFQARGFDIYEQNTLLLLVNPDSPCPNLTEKGCKIYDKRPNICRQYSGFEDFGSKCLWSTLPEYKKKKKVSKKSTGRKKQQVSRKDSVS